MFKEYNPNPVGNNVGDCVIRAITKAMDKSWEDTYIDIVVQGFLHSDMPSSNHVWDAYLRDNGFNRYIMPNFCPDCYTIRQFCYDHPKGTYVLATGSHVVTAIDEYFNVTSTAIITVPKGCCYTVAVENTSATDGTTPAPAINVQNANLVVARIA